jgi:hypothetical protein
MDENAHRAAKLCEMMDDQIRNRTPAERDRLMQQFIAEAMTPAEKFRTLGIMMDFMISLQEARKKNRDG